jgi:hypothetical protein
LITQLNCEKCHSNIRNELNDSLHHTYFSCVSCHQLYSEYHSSSIPPCLTCHGTDPLTVIDQKGSTFIAKTAPVYAYGQGAADSHIPFVYNANNSNLSEGSNIACVVCHSRFNIDINYIRPSYLEWDVVETNGKWEIQNLIFGPMNEISVKNYLDGKSHNISNVNCISCHKDIEQAVVSGGHSNEQWRNKHGYAGYTDMNSYCISCHNPITEDISGHSPYPAYPFNSQVHDAMKISCMDCHGRSGDLIVNINGIKEKAIYDGGSMGNIEESILQQPAFVQSYLCIACKNTGDPDNPSPLPGKPLHFKLYTEPQVTIYINGTQRYP